MIIGTEWRSRPGNLKWIGPAELFWGLHITVTRGTVEDSFSKKGCAKNYAFIRRIVSRLPGFLKLGRVRQKSDFSKHRVTFFWNSGTTPPRFIAKSYKIKRGIPPAITFPSTGLGHSATNPSYSLRSLSLSHTLENFCHAATPPGSGPQWCTGKYEYPRIQWRQLPHCLYCDRNTLEIFAIRWKINVIYRNADTMEKILKILQ